MIRELLAVLTKPNVVHPPLPPDEIAKLVAYLQERFLVAEDGPAVTQELLRLLQRVPAAGKQIHDANIVATMLVHQIKVLLTHNTADFERYIGIIELLPLESEIG